MQTSATKLLWSLWTELGVSGVVRQHQHVAIDPEPLAVFTPFLASTDPRLEEQAFAWCAQHGSAFLSKWRLRGLTRSFPDEFTGPFAQTSSELFKRVGSPWTDAEAKAKQDGLGSLRTVAVRLERRALAPLRARSLFGVGARADVVCAALAAEPQWWTSRDLESLGYSHRAVTTVLDDLRQAGVFVRDDRRKPHAYRWEESSSLAGILNANGLTWTPWMAVLTVVSHLVAFERMDPVESLARVRAHQTAEKIRSVALELSLPTVPQTSGNEQAVEDLSAWGRAWLSSLASGDVPSWRPR